MPKSFYSPLSFSQICCEENNENSISQRLDLKFSGGGSSLVRSCLFQGLLLNLVLKTETRRVTSRYHGSKISGSQP